MNREAYGQRGGRFRRVGIIAARVAGIIAALITISIGALMLILQTRWGGDCLRRQVVARVNREIQGKLSIGRLSFGGDRLVVWDLGLRDPDGHEVAQVSRVEIDFRIMRIVREELRMTSLVIESPRLLVDSDPSGTNLARALAPRERKPSKTAPLKPKSSKEGWVVRLDRFELHDGGVLLASINDSRRKEVLHLEGLQSFLSLRYATGNGSTDLDFRMSGRSVVVPVGPLGINAEARVRGEKVQLSIDGQLLRGTVQARADVDGEHLENGDALVAVAIPRTELGGYLWGPVRIDGRMRPGGIPTLDLSIALPGLHLMAKDRGAEVFRLESLLALEDLARTGKALQALTASTVPSMAGQGNFRLNVEGPMSGAPASWEADCKGTFGHLKYAQSTLADIAIDAQAAHLAKIPGQLDLTVSVGSLVAGTTKLARIAFGAKVRDRALSLSASFAAPEPISLAVEGRVDGDRQGLELSHLSLSYPKVEWVSAGTARLRFEGQKLSLAGLRLHAKDQHLSVDGSKDDERVDARLALKGLRLDLLPALVVPRDLNLGGAVDLDVEATGAADSPKVVARMALEQGRFQMFSRIAATIDATLADQQVHGGMTLHAPFAAVDGDFNLPVDPLSGDPVSLRIEVGRLDLAEVLGGPKIKPALAGRVTARLRVTGRAASPKVVLTVTGHDLNVERRASAPEGVNPADLGQAEIRVSYEDRAAHADLEFASAHGGQLQVDAVARVDLSYPAVSEGVDFQKIPVHGKVVAKEFDVAWMARFNDQIETLGGRVNANAKIAGTVGDPQFIGDIRWKNGKVVTVDPSKAPARQ